MTTAEPLKALLKSHVAGDNKRFRVIALQIVAASAKSGSTQLAGELRGLLDEVRRLPLPAGSPRAVPIARPGGEPAGLITASYPTTQLADMVLDETTSSHLAEVVRQYRQRECSNTMD